MTDTIIALTMPKWGITMVEGTLVNWRVEEGDEISVGDEFAEVETEKMISGVEAHFAGPLRRRVAGEGDVVPVGGLLGVIASGAVADAEVDAFVNSFAVPEDDSVAVEEGPRTVFVVDGALGQVHALALGQGTEAVLFVHGFGGDALNWRFALDQVAEDRTAIAVDLPGHGGSDKAVGDGSVATLAAAVVELIDAQGFSRVHLVGHSIGGLVAATVALARPDRIVSLTLVAPAGFGEEIDAEFVESFARASSRRELKGVLRKLFSDEEQVTRQLVEESLRYKRLDGVSEALARVAGGLVENGRQRERIVDGLGSLEIPLLVVWGADDQVIPAGQAAAAPVAARVEVLDGVGHSPHLEASARFNALLHEHLTSTTKE